MNKNFLNYKICGSMEEAEKACDEWIGGGFIQEQNGGFVAFSMREFEEKIKSGVYDKK